MKTKNVLCGLALAVVLQWGMLAGSAQTNIYLYSGSETNITLPPGTYIITACGAPGGFPSHTFAALGGWGGSGAEMSAEFNFSTSANLTLLVGGGGYPYSPPNGSGYSGGGGGGGSFVVQGGTPLVIAGGGGGGGGLNGGEHDNDVNGNVSNNGGSAIDGPNGNLSYGGGGTDGGGGGGGGYGNGGNGGSEGSGGGGGGYSGGSGSYGNNERTGGGGGGSIIDSSAITILAEVSGSTFSSSPDDPINGEIIITAIPTPLVITTSAAFGFTNGVFGFNLIGPSGSNVVIEASTDLQTWIPLQANLLGSGPLYFSDPQWTNYPERFYRAASAFTVGGTLTGLPAGDTVTLQDNGSDNLTLSTNGTFTFPTALPNGQAYSVTVSGTSVPPPTTCTVTNGSGTISGANVTNVAVQCMTGAEACPALTGNMDEDMYNAAVADGTAHGGVPAVMFTTLGGPFRVTAGGTCSENVALTYDHWAWVDITVGSNSCSSTSFPSGTRVIAFGGPQQCGGVSYTY